MGKYLETKLLRVLEPFIQVFGVAVIAATSFILADGAIAQDHGFPRDWSECDCQYSPSDGMLGCVNVADNEPRGIWLIPGEWKVAVVDKWVSYDSTTIPIAYRIGTDETETSTMYWSADNLSAYSPDPDLYDRLLVAISEERRIAIKLANGPVHIIQGCHDGRREAARYKRTLDRSGQ
ncbi:MAG: hypothetical protein J4G15_03765 [Alphaproteobacteria bacterium]|nr:hypothetical protein [Alphaproteobacteria bacterium]